MKSAGANPRSGFLFFFLFPLHDWVWHHWRRRKRLKWKTKMYFCLNYLDTVRPIPPVGFKLYSSSAASQTASAGTEAPDSVSKELGLTGASLDNLGWCRRLRPMGEAADRPGGVLLGEESKGTRELSLYIWRAVSCGREIRFILHGSRHGARFHFSIERTFI